jgi:D-glycero-D-manno-heptose 1,7-bisphosphate phosphatase
MNQAVFLDRDGTLIEEKEFLHRPEDIVWISGVGVALQRLEKADFLLFIVSNQSGVGRGYFTMADVESVNKRMQQELSRLGVCFRKVYIAPEKPGLPSVGRKPSPHFLFDARDEFGLDLSRSYMIGDKLSDLQCGWNAGVRKSILVRTGYGAETEKELSSSGSSNHKVVIVESLPEAVDWIISRSA